MPTGPPGPPFKHFLATVGFQVALSGPVLTKMLKTLSKMMPGGAESSKTLSVFKNPCKHQIKVTSRSCDPSFYYGSPTSRKTSHQKH